MSSALVQEEDSVSKFSLEDAAGLLLLEEPTPGTGALVMTGATPACVIGTVLTPAGMRKGT